MKKTAFTIFSLFICTFVARGQGLGSILQSIEKNNAELRAMLMDNEAVDADMRAENTLAGPSVEYSPFWQKGVSGMSSTELIVSQEFDFPTLYSSRNRSADMESRALSLRYEATRCELLLEAKLKCLELIKLGSERNLIDRRLTSADNLLEIVKKMEERGDITALDLNKLRMERMSLEASARINEAQQIAVRQSLLEMNSSEPLTFEGLEYPETPMIASYDDFRTKAIESDATVKAALGDVAAAGQQLSVSRMGWLPSLSMGFRRNTVPGEAQNGLVVGMSFPVWSTGKHVKAARARKAAAELRADEATRQVEARIRSQYNELQTLDTTVRSYDPALMSETLRLLGKALEGGQITVIEYFNETALVYGKMQELMDAQYQYQVVMASLTRSSL